MTREQKAWLDAHPDYELVPRGGAIPGGGDETAAHNDFHRDMLALNEDGTAVRKKCRPPALLVGIRKPIPATPGGPMGPSR